MNDDWQNADRSASDRSGHESSCRLVMGRVRARPGALERSRRGAAIGEFALTLISLFLLIFFPCCNAVLFWSAYVSLDNINREAVESMAMSDTMQVAERRSHQLLTRYTNPLLTLYQLVKLDSQSDSHLTIVVNHRGGETECYEAARGLPRDQQPGYRNNRCLLSYSYRLQVNCVIRPFFNLSSIPVIGQAPIIGRATQVSVAAMAPVENLDSLTQSVKPIDQSEGVNQIR